jgi:hypothetical protein
MDEEYLQDRHFHRHDLVGGILEILITEYTLYIFSFVSGADLARHGIRTGLTPSWNCGTLACPHDRSAVMSALCTCKAYR